MKRDGKQLWLGFALAFGSVTVPGSQVHAQWSGSMYTAAEYDTNESLFLMAGLSATPAGGGWQPLLGLSAYRLSYDGGTGKVSVVSVRPSVGLRNSLPWGGVNFNVGYAFTNKDEDVLGTPRSAVADAGEGVFVSAGVDVERPENPWAFQGLASYNFGGGALWSRARVTRAVMQGPNSKVKFGPELAYLSDDSFNAIKPGVVLLWQSNTGTSVGLGVGRQFVNEGEDATYFKVEAGFPIF